MTLEIQQFLDEAPPNRERVDRFLTDHKFPLVDGRRVTFVFHGQADRVNLRHFIYGLPSSQPLTRVPQTDLWFLVMDLPVCSRVEYKIERIHGENREWMMDPLNPNVAHDPYGANSVCYGEGYVTPEWTEADSDARPGTLEELVLPSRALGGSRSVRVYLPARFRRRRRYPLLVVHDGEDYLRFAELKVVLDNLIHRLEIPPMIVALTQAGDRTREYGADPRHGRFLAEELLPALGTQYPLLDTPRSRGLMGASFGAVAALHAAWRQPGVWGNLLVQSGSFVFSDIGDHDRGPVFDPVVDFVNSFREEPTRPADKVFISCGIFEALIYENRSIVPLLQSTGMEVRYVEARDGHNWDNWRDRLREGLSWLFPGPLWMVYE
jgi:enterochelin esterase family protein